VAEDDDGAVCWVSSAGCLTPLHYDLDEGLLAQVMGEKRVWLYDYKDRGSLYMRGDEGRAKVDSRTPVGLNNWERQSHADFHGGRRAAFPKALSAQRWEAHLKPGELLYIPAGWFHEVHSLTPSFSLGWRFGLPEPDDSEPSLRRTLASARNTRGAAHKETLDAALALSRLLFRQQRFEEAEPLNREILDGVRAAHGHGSEDAMLALSNLGLVVARRGKLTEAGTLLAEALGGLRSKDAEDPRLHSIAANLAEIRHLQGRLPAAEALYQEALALRRKALGDVHPMTKQLAKLLESPLQPM
jgi:tetratricopeptide (TPR) repeat protein